MAATQTTVAPQERHGCLNVGDPAVGREPAARPRTLPPALVIEGHHHVPGLGERPRVVRKVQVLDPRVAVAQDDARPRLAGREVRGIEDVADELVAFAVERDRLGDHGGIVHQTRA